MISYKYCINSSDISGAVGSWWWCEETVLCCHHVLGLDNTGNQDLNSIFNMPRCSAKYTFNLAYMYQACRQHAWKALALKIHIIKMLLLLGRKTTFLLGIWILFIWFGQNLERTYQLTLGTSMVKIQDGNQIWPYKLHFGSAFGSGSSNLDKIWHGHTTWP